MKTRTEYEQTFKTASVSNPFIVAALAAGWSYESILGVLIDRNNSTIDRVLILETKLKELQNDTPCM